jgi:hypothetical protein
MDNKKIIWIGMLVGSFIGGYIPALWGANMLSMSSVFLTAIGGMLGIWLGYKFTNY